MFKKFKVGVVYDPKLVQYQNIIKEKALLNPVYLQHEDSVNRVYNYLKKRKYDLETIIINGRLDSAKLIRKSFRVIVVPELCFVDDETFFQLEEYVKKGGVLFTAYPSFWFNKSIEVRDTNNLPADVSIQRFRNLFGASHLTEKKIEGYWKWSYISPPEWIKSLPKTHNYNGCAVIAGNPTCEALVELYLKNATEIDETRQSSPIPRNQNQPHVFLLREYSQNGFFIYSCVRYFEIFEKDGIQSLVDNIIGLAKANDLPKGADKLSDDAESRLNKIEKTQKWHSRFIQLFLAVILFFALYKLIPFEWFSGDILKSFVGSLFLAFSKDIVYGLPKKVWKKLNEKGVF